MSKLVSGTVQVNDLDLVREAAQALGWLVSSFMPVRYYAGAGAVCDVNVIPKGERDRYGHEVGDKYSIGFQQDAATGKITMLHDNAMNGAEVYSAESGKMDDTTTRVVGTLKQAIAEAQVQRILKKQKASWRVEQRADGAKVYVVRR